MSYFPAFIDPEEDILILSEFVKEDYWSRIDYKDISDGDRLLVVRLSGGIRSISEFVAARYEESLGAWVNNLGSPVVSILDIHIFRAGEPRDDQSEVSRDALLGG